MEVSHSNSSSSSVRVLVRSQSSSSTSKTHHHVPSTPSDPQPSSSPSNGVVVVGFIGPRPDVTTQIINRIVDGNVFGSGNCDTTFFVDNGELKSWFELRRISYFHDHQDGILYLQFSSSSCFGFGSALEDEEELEFGDLQGLLFMFSVCHVIIYIQDGLRFDTQLLKKFRVLQAAKLGLAPFVKTQITATLPSGSRQAMSAIRGSSTSSPGKNRSILSRGASVSVMSGFGSYTSLFPGQCTPVMLFVFLEDFSDTPNPKSIDSPTSQNQSRPNLQSKNSGPVLVLSRPANKSEGGFKKTLQSSLETQIRFLIKKCRTFSGSETGHAGSRSGGVSSSAPLFSLDSSRAVALLDRSANRRAEPLEFATRLVEDVLNGKATPDSLLLESSYRVVNKEDMLSVKDFIYRQSDILRGGRSAGGVSMVAVAAAVAAAASASTVPGKPFAAPELPSMEIWLSSSRQILSGVISAKGGCFNEIELSKRKPRPRTEAVVIASKTADPLDVAVSWLGSGKGLNTKFSTLWCERSLPTAKEIYLKDLPPCYPAPTHEAHLDKALRAFYSMVKGPAVQLFVKKLEDECTAVWESGRRLCDSVSLTGKPCTNQIHDLSTVPHCSGYVYLHACACGRSRRPRLDPFDFESANFDSDCDKLLPTVQLLNSADAGPIEPSSSSWSLVRVGGSKYYEPSKGLLQSGFCATQKFLLKWESRSSVVELSTEPEFEPKTSTDVTACAVDSGVENKRKPSETVVLGDKKISFGKGLPNVIMRKPFAEVVAGSASGNSDFPPLQQSKKPNTQASNTRHSKTEDPSVEQQSIDHRGSRKPEGTLIAPGNSNVGPVHRDPGQKIRTIPSYKNITVYVGFEHECPCGHRFILNPEHLKELGKFYQPPEESRVPSSSEVSSHRPPTNPSKPNGNGRRGKSRQILNRAKVSNGSPDLDKEPNHLSFGVSKLQACDFGSDLRGSLEGVRVDKDGQGFSILNRNLPIYMNCPHCRNSKNDRESPKVKFAGTVSQLQRIFLVTPPFPVVLATCPVVQFEASCLPRSIPHHDQKLRFSLGCEVVLPPESFLSLRLPFFYGVRSEDGTQHPLNYFQHQPEATAWLTKGTALKIVSKPNDDCQ